MNEHAILSAHSALSEDIREVPWLSNCAGEVFLDDNGEHGVRIGHFQGDQALAAFIVEVHNSVLAGCGHTSAPREAQQ